MRVLFICKRNECYGFEVYTRRSAGLYNSTSFIVKGLRRAGIESAIVEVQDNNDIDRVVSRMRPDIVVIEALWVVPEKFDVLKKLHPQVRWLVHLHSHMPFLALEGIAIEWITKCVEKGVKMIANSFESYQALLSVLNESDLFYLPNVYSGKFRKPQFFDDKPLLDIGCFGAVRPLKSHLLQAMAAIRFANELQLPMQFHINSSRVETNGEPVLKNLRALFDVTPNCALVDHHWMESEEFLQVCHRLDIGMQVSLSETFNVVSADYVTSGIPIVVSKEVSWASRFSKAIDDDILDIVKVMKRVYKNRALVEWNQWLLSKNCTKAEQMWVAFVKKH